MYETSRWHRKARPLLAMEGLVFVYDLPARFNNESLQLPLPWHSEQYDFDVKVHEHLLASPLRTTNPAEAKLFYMPVYLARQMNWFWQRTDIEVRRGVAWYLVDDRSRPCTPLDCVVVTGEKLLDRCMACCTESLISRPLGCHKLCQA